MSRKAAEFIRYDDPDDRKVEIGPHAISKTAPPEIVALEVTKTRLAHEIGKRTGLFIAPEVQAHDSVGGTAVFGRVDDVEPLGHLERRLDVLPDLPEKLASALAAIHSQMDLPEDLRRPLPAECLREESPDVVVHGDFTGRNVLIRVTDGAIVLIDWMTTYRLGELCTTGPAWFDLAWFIRWQYLRPGFGAIPNAAAAACTRFVRAYLAIQQQGTLSEFGSYLLQLSVADRRRRDVCFSLRRRLAALRGDLALVRYARSLMRSRGA